MRNLLWTHLMTGALSLVVAVPTLAEQVVFEEVLGVIQTKPDDRRLRYKEVDLMFDDDARMLLVRSKDRPLAASYDDVLKVIFEVSTDFKSGLWISGIPTGIGRGVLHDQWCYLEYRTAAGDIERYLLKIERDDASDVVRRTQTLFGDRVTVASFPENANMHEIDKEELPALDQNHDMTVDKDRHPVPEIRDDQALVVVVSPAQQGVVHGKGHQVKIHVNGEVMAVNRAATYGWFYLDPGEYQLVSQASNASALSIEVEPGQAYYFLQYASFGGFTTRTALVRHTKERVMYELDGAYYSVWRSKQ